MYSYAYFMAGRVEDAWRMQERKPRETEAMRKAGFPACATAEDLKNVPGIKQLPEGEAERAKAAAMSS